MYFAKEDKDNIARECMVKVDDYYNYLEVSGKLYLYRSVYDLYYRARTTKGQLYISGSNGQYLNMDTADFRNLLQHLKVMATKSRSSFIPISTNSDFKSESQTRVAKNVLEYYMKEKKIGRILDQAAELAILYADSYICEDWDASLGETAMVEPVIGEDGQPELDENGEPKQNVLKEGDLVAKSYGPIDVPIDFSRKSPHNHDWYITRDWINKYEVSSKYPELADEIESLSDQVSFNNKDRLYVYNQRENYNSDIIPMYTFYHKKSASMPDGRMTRFLNSNILLFDGPLPFKKIPIYRMVPCEEGESAFGYSISFDLLPICSAIVKLYSTLITTETVSGIPILLIPENANMDLTDLTDGIKSMTYNPSLANGAKPETLHLGQSSEQTYRLIELLRDLSQTISAINAVARGEVPPSLESGSALALVLSTAIEFNSGLQRAYAEISEDAGTGIINILQIYAKTKRILAIAGKAQASSMQEWSNEDLDSIDRVTVEIGNPILQTSGGCMQMAENLLNKGLVKTAKQYLEVMMTGKLDSMVEDDQAELLYIRQENEQLSLAEQIPAILTDQHLYHIERHKSVLFSKQAKENPQIVNAVLDHIQEHIDILANPAFANILSSLGQAPTMPQMPPPESGPPPPDQEGPPSSIPQGSLPNMPKMPINPANGERVGG